MSRRRADQAVSRLNWIHSSRLHVVLYSFLLVATPFILLRNYLVEFISKTSHTTLPLGPWLVPVVPLVAGLLVVAVLIPLRKRLTRLHLLAVLVAVLMDAAAQQITDYYFGHRFYDLQQNWHYVAYGLFGFMVYRDGLLHGYPLNRIMLTTYFGALGFSAFDESFQMFMSSRVFDISDIAKDLWGTCMGMVLVYLSGSRSAALLADFPRVRRPHLREYLQYPFGLLVLMIIFAFLLVCISSLLTDFDQCWKAVVLSIATFAVIFTILHVSQFRGPRYVLLTLLVAGLAAQGYAFAKYRTDNIVYNRFGLTVYKGFVLPFFDFLFFPDGSFRPVDKKHYFNARDQYFLLGRVSDILIVGTGAYGLGGQGFPEKDVNQFVFNPHTHRGTQVIILPTPEACEVFNRLKREHKNVLFVLHNSC